MKSIGRRHRPFFRICAMDARTPRDGRAIEELGHYDPMVRNNDARTVLNVNRIRYWLSVGAQPSEKVQALLNRHGVKKPAPGEPWQLPETRAGTGTGIGARSGGRGRAPRRPPDRERPDAETRRCLRRRVRFDLLTLFPALFDGIPEREHPEAGDRQGAGRGPPLGHPRLGRGEAPAGGRPPLRRRARAWC